MRLSLPSQKIVLKILALIVGNVLLMWTWALINVKIQLTPTWMDTLWGIILIALNLYFLPIIPKIARYKKALRWFIGVMILIVGVIGWVYSFAYTTESFTWIIRPLIELSNFLILINLDNTIVHTEIIHITFIYLGLSLIVCFFSFVFKNSLINRQEIKIWQNNYEKFRIAFRWRPGRLLAGIGRSLLLFLIISSMVISLVALVNALPSNNIPFQVRTISGPTILTSVGYLLQDSRDGTLYAGTSSGVFRSRDGGDTWQTASAGLDAYANVQTLLQDNQDGTLYAGTEGLGPNGGVLGNTTGETTISRSRDGGETWEDAGNGLNLADVRSLQQGNQDRTLYAGTSRGVFRFRDGDDTWEAVSADLTDTNVLTLLQDSRDGTLYAGTSSGVFRFRDGDDTWEAASAGLTGIDVRALLQDSRDGTLYAGTWNGIYRSKDGGNTWEATSAELTGRYVLTLLQDSQDGTLYAGTSNGVFCSRDGGDIWESASVGLEGIYVLTLLQDSQDGTLYAGTSGHGVYRSQDGGDTWESTSAGLAEYANVLTLLQDSRDGTLYAGTSSGVFRFRDGDDTWEAASTGLTGIDVRALLQDSRDGTLYAGTWNGIYRSKDGGNTWEAASTGLTGVDVHTLLQDSQDGTLYAGTGRGIYRSKHGGDTWEAAVSAGLTGVDVQTLLQDSRDGTLYAGTEIGIYRSKDGGDTWQTASSGLATPVTTVEDYPWGLVGTWEVAGDIAELEGVDVSTLLQDNRDGTLYAGTWYSIYRSRDGGDTWESASAGLTDTHVLSLLRDSRDGVLYAGTSNGIYRSRDGGDTWEAASTGLRARDVQALLQDSWDGTLYAGTESGVFRFWNGGDTWEAARAGLTETLIVDVNILLQDSQSSTLYAGTSSGVFRLRDEDDTWEAVSAGLAEYANVLTLLQDSRDGVLYAGTSSGVFRFRDGDGTWESASAGLTDTHVLSLLQDSRDGVLYAGTRNGIYRSRDGGDTWEAASAGLTDTDVNALLQDSRDGTLYAGTTVGIFRSKDGGDTWEAASAGLTGTDVNALLQDSRDGALYAGTWYGGIFRSKDGGSSWKPLPDSCNYLLFPDWLISNRVELPPEMFNGMALSNQPLQAIQTGKYYYAWGATIVEIQVAPQIVPHRSLFWTLRTWTKFWFIPRVGYFASGTAFLLVVWGLIAWGSAFWPIRQNPFHSSKIRETINAFYAGESVHPILQKWNNKIYTELVAFGDVLPEDLIAIPELLRRQMMDGFCANYQEALSIQWSGRRLMLLAGKRLKNWQITWRRISDDLGRHHALSPQGQDQVCLLAQSLSDGLGFTLEESHLSKSICAWRVDAPALRLNLPARFPLVFVADPNPTPETVRQLVDTVSILKDTNNFALVVPLEPSMPDADIPSVLRRLIDASPYAHDFIILTQQDVVDVLIARHPERVLVQHISRQVDLSFISPFIINGPVPPQMFFGRDREIRTLVDHAGKRNYAIVGNRKIGKTSLLNQIESRINHQGGIRLLRMDCQAVREAADFYAKLQQIPGMQTDISSPAALAVALRTLQKQSDQPLVFVLDELDDLLKAEKDRDESVLSVMRELANEQTCWFIFCGSKILIRQLRDSESALFNFPETLALTCLSREEMDEVITRPLETLGIHMDDVSAVLDAAWALTSGHPNLTQFVGRVLVNASNENQNRSIGQADVENLWTDAAFVQFYFDTIWGAASPLERLITLLMPPEPFGSSDVEKVFHAVGASVTSIQIDAGLETLVAYSVLKRVGRLHTFVPMAFHRLLDLNYEKERLIAREVEKVNGGME